MSSSYLGLWYKKGIPESAVIPTEAPSTSYDGQSVVWVANRDASVRDTSGVFTIERNGTMTISGSRASSFLLHAGNSSGGVTLTLLDSGNMISRGTSTGNGRVLWESFNYPVAALLPGMRLSSEVPARGAFALGIDPSGSNQLIIWERGEVYWKSGVWNGTNFGSVTGLTINDVLNPRFVTKNDENYFSFSVTNSSIASWWSLEESGPIWQPILREGQGGLLSLEPQEPCLGTESDRSKGCVKRTGFAFQCDIGDTFSVNRRQTPSDPPTRTLRNLSLALSDCKANENGFVPVLLIHLPTRTALAVIFMKADWGLWSVPRKKLIYIRGGLFQPQVKGKNLSFG